MPEPVPASGTMSGMMVDLLCDPVLDSRQREVEALTLLYDSHTPARHLYFIRSGQVRILMSGPATSARLVEILGSGDWFGVPALAGSATYESRAVAMTRATLCQVPIDRLMAHLPQMPEVAGELVRQLARKHHASLVDAANLVFEDTYQRLVTTLLQFSRTAAATPGDGGEVVLQITHQQLAEAVGAARETVSLTLTTLRQQNVLRTGRNRLWFNPAALERFVLRARAQSNGSAGDSRQAEAALPQRGREMQELPAEPTP